MSAKQRISKKTYLEMDDETKAKIEALYYTYRLNMYQIGDIVDWPWQSCSKHIKVVNDRIEYGKTNLEKILTQAEQTIAKYSLDLYVNGIPETSDPALTEEMTVIDPEALAKEFPEIVRPVDEPASTQSEISVPRIEDAPNCEERDSEVENGAESVKFAGEEEPGELARLFDDLDCQEPEPMPINSYPEHVFGEPRNETPVSRNEPTDPEHDRRVRKDVPFYLTLQNIIDRYEAGDIVFEGMTLNESKGVLYIEYATA